MKFSGALKSLDIDASGRVTLVIKSGDDEIECTIPPDRAIDSLMPLLMGIARASEKPGPAYRTMIAPIGIRAEHETAIPGSVPYLALVLDRSATLHIALAPQTLRPLAEQMKQIDRAIRKKSGS